MSIEASRRRELLGVRFDDLSRNEVLDAIETYIAERRPRIVCTPNADHVLRVRSDPEFREVVDGADLVVSDGMGVVYASRLLGRPLRENVGGRLLVRGLASRAALHGYRLFLLGGRDGRVANRAAARLVRENPGLVLPGTYSPPHMAEFGEVETGRMLAAVHEYSPDVLFVCLGTPKQEKWIWRNRHSLDVPVSVGVGAGVDMLGGFIREPPAWMTRAGLEWVARCAQEPCRMIARYGPGIPRFVLLVVRARLAARVSSRSKGTDP